MDKSILDGIRMPYRTAADDERLGIELKQGMKVRMTSSYAKDRPALEEGMIGEIVRFDWNGLGMFGGWQPVVMWEASFEFDPGHYATQKMRINYLYFTLVNEDDVSIP